MDMDSALHQVLKNAMAVDGVCKGIRECAKALEKRTAIICIVAQNCDQKAYIVLAEALCREHNIPCLQVIKFSYFQHYS
ncbi:UNVERIFIED_CONTAM: hypothetical protein GTU68_042794 [Idotea baltica]|nr:hypothetical protein [Idotea baltica]